MKFHRSEYLSIARAGLAALLLLPVAGSASVLPPSLTFSDVTINNAYRNIGTAMAAVGVGADKGDVAATYAMGRPNQPPSSSGWQATRALVLNVANQHDPYDAALEQFSAYLHGVEPRLAGAELASARREEEAIAAERLRNQKATVHLVRTWLSH